MLLLIQSSRSVSSNTLGSFTALDSDESTGDPSSFKFRSSALTPPPQLTTSLLLDDVSSVIVGLLRDHRGGYSTTQD